MAGSTVLVTGAAGGRQGSTGRHVARLLLERGVPVRALVHHLDERSDELTGWGAEVVEGDLLDRRSVRAAIRGVRRAYFAYPVQDGLVDASVIFAEAARSAGTDMVVNLSQLLQRAGDQPTPHQTRHWLSEQVFDWADVGAVHLDAVVFFENLRALAGPSIARAGVVALPWGPHTTAIPMVCAEDVARVAVGLLTGPAQPRGTVLALIGDVVTNSQIAETLSEVLGRRIGYREISDDQWVTNIAGAGINPTAVEHLVHLWRYLRTRPADYQASYQATDTIETIGGAKPKTLRHFLTEQKQTTFAELANNP
jgi:uncharacterized protein YbjT (DUF2867 family)